MVDGYVDCGAGFVNDIQDLPASVECCEFPRAGELEVRNGGKGGLINNYVRLTSSEF